MPRHFLLLADVFPPLRSSGAVQLRDLAAEFARQGHRITVVVPTTRLSEATQLEEFGRLQVLRVRSLRSKDVPYWRRTIAEAVLPWMMRIQMIRHRRALSKVDGVIWYSPTIFLSPAVRWIKRQHHCRSYLIVRDLFPDWALDMGLLRRGIVYRLLKWVERRQYAIADVIGVQTVSNEAPVRTLIPDTPNHIEVLHNWLEPTEPRSSAASEQVLSHFHGRSICIYAGNMGVAQGVDIFLDAAHILRPDARLGFVFMGRGSELDRLKQKAARLGLTNTLFIDEVEPSEVPGVLSVCDIGLLALDPALKVNNIPGKFLTYMFAGIPVVGRVNSGNELIELVHEFAVGKCLTGNDATELAGAISQVAHSNDSSDSSADTTLRCRALANTKFLPNAAVAALLFGLDADRGQSIC